MTDSTTASANVTQQKDPKRAALAAWIGSALEYYDFFIYGTAASLVFGQIMFPRGNPTAALLASLATFGVGYVARPIGSFFMGYIGDRVGRKALMMLTLLMMGIGTFLIGCLPTYDQIGMAAPVLLVVLRLVQGFSAAGEQAGANSLSFEHAPSHRRGYFTSWTLSGTAFGQVLGPLVFIPLSVMLPREDFLAWGWRIPFWLSVLVVAIGYYIRRHLEEAPEFEAEKAERKAAKAQGEPAAQENLFAGLFKHHWGSVLHVFFCALIAGIGTIFTVFTLSFANDPVYGNNLGATNWLWVTAIGNAVSVLTMPLFAILSDKVGRRPVFIIGDIGCVIVTALMLWAVSAHNLMLAAGLGILLFGIPYAMTNAVWPVTYSELFATKDRATGMAVGTQFGFMIGGFAPVFCALLVGVGGTPAWVGPAIYAGLIASASALSLVFMRETFRTPLDQLGLTKAERAALDAAPAAR